MPPVCNDNVSTKENRLNLRVSEQVRKEFHAAARLRGAKAAGLIHQFMVKIIREEKEHNLQAFEAMMQQLASEDANNIIQSPSPRGKQQNINDVLMSNPDAAKKRPRSKLNQVEKNDLERAKGYIREKRQRDKSKPD